MTPRKAKARGGHHGRGLWVEPFGIDPTPSYHTRVRHVNAQFRPAVAWFLPVCSLVRSKLALLPPRGLEHQATRLTHREAQS